METIHIKPLSLPASRIGLGTWAIGGWLWGGTDESESIKTIHAALDKGINLIDTAPVYGFGLSEEIVGKAIKQYGNREAILIATKAGLSWKDQQVFRNATPEHIRKELEDSLRRLQTDYIDIYQIHWPDPRVPAEDTAKVLLEFFNEGKIRAIGVSNYSTTQMQAFMKVAPIHTSQPPYNLFERDIEKTILPFCEKYQMATLGYGALCRGLLSGKMNTHTHFEGDDIRKLDPKFKHPHFDAYLAAVAELDQYAHHEFGKNVLTLAVRWVLDRGHTIALWGARHPKQLDAIPEVMGWNLDAEHMLKIDAILQKHIPEPIGSEFMAPPAQMQR